MTERIHFRGILPRGITTEALHQAAFWGFIILGILFRLRQYLFARSLWLDESMLALNIIKRSPAELLKPLDNAQGASVGFLWLEKLAVHWFGSGEMALRLLPFLSGIGAVLLFALAARKLLAPGVVPIAVGLFSLCSPLIYYSSEAKQYSTDVVVVLILYLMARPLLDAPLKISRVIVFSLVGALVVWFSHPAVFVLAGLGLSALWVSLRKNDRPALLKIAFVIAMWSCSFLVLYWISLRSLSHNNVLINFWSDAFPPFPSSPTNVMWYVHSFFGVFAYPGGMRFMGIAAVAAVLGAVEVFRMHQGRFLLFVLPTAVTLVASWLHLYPFQGRLLLFIVPSAIMLIAAGLGSIHKKTCSTIPLLSALLIGFLFLHPLADATRDFAKPRRVEEIRPVIEYVQEHAAEGDTLYCYYASRHALEYYSLRGLIRPMSKVIGEVPWDNGKSYYREDLDRLRGRNRVWVLFSHIWTGAGEDEDLLFLDYLDTMGKRLDSSRASGASVYLYDLSTPKGKS